MALVRGVIRVGGFSWLKSRTQGVVIAERLSRFFPRYAPVQPTSAPTILQVVPTAVPKQLGIEWANATTDPSCTNELWVSSDNVTFTLLAPLPLSTTVYYHDTGVFNAARWYKVRHVNVTDDGPFSASAGNSSTGDIPTGSPSSLVATTPSTRPTGETRIDLTWVNGDSGAQTQILDVGRSVIATAAAGATSISITGRSPNTSYSFITRHSKPGGVSAESNTASATTLVDGPDAPPTSPGAVGGTGVSGQNSTFLSWVNGDSTAQTEIWESADNVTFSLAITRGVTVTTFTHNPGFNTLRYYKFRHTKGGVVSAFTSVVSATSGQDIPDAPPSGLSVSTPGMPTGETNLDLNWANGDASCSTQIRRGGVGITVVGPGVTSYRNPSLSPNTTYGYTVSHVKNSVESAQTGTVNGTTLVDGPDASPSGLSAAWMGGDTIRLTWSNGDPTASSIIYRVGYGGWASVGPGVTTYDYPIGNGVTSSWYVGHTKNSVLSPSQSNTATVTVPSIPLPVTGAVCSVPAAPAGETQLVLSWSNQESAAQTVIFISTDGASWSVYDAVNNPGASYTVFGRAPSTTYYFLLRVTRDGLSSSDVVVSAGTLTDGPDAPPSALHSVSTTSSETTIGWTNGDASAQTRVFRNGTLRSTRAAGTTSFTDSTLSNTTYSWWVQHIKNGVLSDTSDTAVITTPGGGI